LFYWERLLLKIIVEAFVAGSFFDCEVEPKALDGPITTYNSLAYFLL
jgi:hypothetical protein